MSNFRKALLSFAGLVVWSSILGTELLKNTNALVGPALLVGGGLLVSTAVHLIIHADDPCGGCLRRDAQLSQKQEEIHRLHEALIADSDGARLLTGKAPPQQDGSETK